MFVKAVVLAALVAFVVSQEGPCIGNECPTGQRCDIPSQECYPISGGSDSTGGVGGTTCEDKFTGKGDCAQFQRKGFCKSGNKALVEKWCAKTCGVCTAV
ncbi:hypothetical protein QR680_010295 [Steinernema hermaphroditum]|uniref:ShKT domain-containing protein n=1 Tax=Steinernema hermaphroditum TaxID=289476 RepID=A0AA39MAF2_9BILA|nr:hypothetical protein QR680_010295 [Steinernema hermaphroditum]